MINTKKLQLYFGIFLFLYTIFALYVYLYILPAGGSLTILKYFVYVFSGLLGLVASIWLVKIFGSKFAFNTPWGLMLGILCWVIGDIYLHYSDFSNTMVYPSFSDYMYILAYPCFLVGIFSQSKILFRQPRDKNRGAWMAAGAFIIFLLLRFFYFGNFDPENSIYQNIFNTLYSIGDSSLVAGCVYILYIIVHIHEGKLVWPWIHILLGFIFNLIGFAIQTLYLDKYFSSDLGVTQMADIVWIIGYMFSAYGIFSLACVYKDFQEKIRQKTKFKTIISQ